MLHRRVLRAAKQRANHGRLVQIRVEGACKAAAREYDSQMHGEIGVVGAGRVRRVGRASACACRPASASCVVVRYGGGGSVWCGRVVGEGARGWPVVLGDNIHSTGDEDVYLRHRVARSEEMVARKRAQKTCAHREGTEQWNRRGSLRLREGGGGQAGGGERKWGRCCGSQGAAIANATVQKASPARKREVAAASGAAPRSRGPRACAEGGRRRGRPRRRKAGAWG